MTKTASSSEGVPCPYCGNIYQEIDGDEIYRVINYQSTRGVDFSCEECGEEFIVDEIVTRRWTSRKRDE